MKYLKKESSGFNDNYNLHDYVIWFILLLLHYTQALLVKQLL